jgi:hypothetical protein
MDLRLLLFACFFALKRKRFLSETGAPYLSESRRLIRPSGSEAGQTREEGFTWGMQQSITVQQWG